MITHTLIMCLLLGGVAALMIGCTPSAPEAQRQHLHQNLSSALHKSTNTTQAGATNAPGRRATSNRFADLLIDFDAYANLFHVVKYMPEEEIDFSALSNVLISADFDLCRVVFYEFGDREEYFAKHFVAAIAFTRARTQQQRIHAMLACAHASSLMGDDEACRRELEMTHIENTPEFANYIYQKLSLSAKLYSHDGDYKRAIECLTKGLDISDTVGRFARPNLLLQLGTLHLRNNDPGNARQAFAAFVALDSDHYQLYPANVKYAMDLMKTIDANTWQRGVPRVASEAERIIAARKKGVPLSELQADVRADMPPPDTPTRKHMLNVKLKRLETIYNSNAD